ncbi:hypothetical protein BpHYR1_014053 [Brachionus plicatilis]|uniref:Uncharacterized protein n=1 Tax=Brachionus plicatilis TaxID=10195 RepID=A0A3M7T6A9_BRAPC|nr:hypothetical protein BpHYR1_014053 [Brachionus plicatilis]
MATDALSQLKTNFKSTKLHPIGSINNYKKQIKLISYELKQAYELYIICFFNTRFSYVFVIFIQKT